MPASDVKKEIQGLAASLLAPRCVLGGDVKGLCEFSVSVGGNVATFDATGCAVR